MDLFQTLALGFPIVFALLVVASLLHAWFAGGKWDAEVQIFRPRVIIVCLVHLLFGGAAYWHLITGGWLATAYSWHDPDDINLVLAVFEALCVIAVMALVAVRKRFVYKLLVDLLIIQIISCTVFLLLVLWVVLTWKPKMF